MLGLETAAALTWSALEGDAHAFFDVLSRGPARVAQVRQGEAGVRRLAHGGTVAPGEAASLVIFDPAVEWTVDRERLHSRARNTPFHAMTLNGQVRATIVGEPVWWNGEFR
jgi:dihydroorotase